MGIDTINGFDVKEVSSLYHIVKLYEDNALKKCIEKDALIKVPSLADIKDVCKSFTFEERTINELKTIDIKNLNNVLYYTRHKSELMGLLYHLRNAIAHTKIVKDGDKVIILDYSPQNSNDCTAKGIISFEKVDQIAKIAKKLNLNK